MKRNHFLFIVNTLLLYSINCLLYAQIPSIQWQKCLGGTSSDYAASVLQTSDGGYIYAGSTISNDVDVSGNHGGSDVWIVKLSNNGNIQWQKCLGGSNFESASYIQQTSDGGYVFTGYSYSNDGDVSGNHGSSDVWIVKLSNNGYFQWQKCLGGTSSEYSTSVIQTFDGGYIVAGQSSSNNGDVSGNHGSSDIWIVKLSNNGNIQWQKCLGGSNSELENYILQTSDGGYIVAGQSSSNDGDLSGNHGSSDIWIVKLSNNGNIQWQKCLGGSNYENVDCIYITSDGGYIVAGQSSSNDGDVTGNHGGSDVWIVKLSNFGIIEWQKCLGGTSLDYATSVIQTSNDGYVVAGASSSNNGDVSGNHGSGDVWIVNLTNSGLLNWQKCIGGSSSDYAEYIRQTSDDGFIIAGNSYSYNGDVSGNHGSGDGWVIKISPDYNFINQNIELQKTQVFPNPAKSLISINFDFDLIGENYLICNSIGQVILTGIIISESMKIDLSKFSNGLYIIRIGNKNNQTVKLIIE